MKAALVCAAILAGGAGIGAARPATPYAQGMVPFQRQLARLCPAKHLEWLAPAELRDVLDDYAATAAPDRRRAMATAEAHLCATSIAGATCPNVADLMVARRQGFAGRLATLTCRRFRGCAGQSDCDLAD